MFTFQYWSCLRNFSNIFRNTFRNVDVQESRLSLGKLSDSFFPGIIQLQSIKKSNLHRASSNEGKQMEKQQTFQIYSQRTQDSLQVKGSYLVDICFLEMLLYTQLLVLNKFVLPRKQSACKFSIFMLGDNLFTHVITILLIIILKFKWYFQRFNGYNKSCIYMLKWC